MSTSNEISVELERTIVLRRHLTFKGTKTLNSIIEDIKEINTAFDSCLPISHWSIEEANSEIRITTLRDWEDE